jgi:hypothetical protein
MKSISFSVDDIEYRLIAAEARARGLTASQLAKTALFSHMNKYPMKGVMAEFHRLTEELHGQHAEGKNGA